MSPRTPKAVRRKSRGEVAVRREPLVLPTYRPVAPDKNPMFLDRRVYQGSCGKVYPLPFYDRIEEKPRDVAWDAIHIENDFLHVILLPQLGGRIYAVLDKTNGYDLFYRQKVIKPALVGLAGPWVSGGVEFNWPQHHRPSTYMPAETSIERGPDGSVTVWLSEHEPMKRMKGMHGVRLRPGSATVELRVRLYNRTPLTQTFLWWANVAARVHERYQSFFPPDVHQVADHAKRAVSEFPLCRGRYYGVDYAARARVRSGGIAGNDLSWFGNIPVPTSYMCAGSEKDFFGGYDHAAGAGFVHVADHHIAPGKKQWTWGHSAFGRAWDRNLSDGDDPYIELMAGAYTDNQPDFSFLGPGETKSFSQVWYPIQGIGVPVEANARAAVSVIPAKGKLRVGVCASERYGGARVEVRSGNRQKAWKCTLAPGKPFFAEMPVSARVSGVTVFARDGSEIVRYARSPKKGGAGIVPAAEPPAPGEMAGADELYLAGLHLDQYRHATRRPEDYWREALRRDPGDSRCNNAMGLWHLRRGELGEAERCFRASVARVVARNPNPRDGEPYYNLGVALRRSGRDAEAYAAFFKAAWNQAWKAPAHHALAEIDAARANWRSALEHVDRSLALDSENLRARNLRAIALGRLGHAGERRAQLERNLALDPLDWWAAYLLGRDMRGCPAQTRIDVALDFASAGLLPEAIIALRGVRAEEGTAPLLDYYRGWFSLRMDRPAQARRHFRAAARRSPDYCFPSRAEDFSALECAASLAPRDARAPYYLGCLLYDRGRGEDAIKAWEQSVRLDASLATAWRNLGLAHWNVRRDAGAARRAYARALRADPSDARLLYERDQLCKKAGVGPESRLRVLRRRHELVARRDDLCLEHCSLLNQLGEHAAALEELLSRNFQPWEGGEGKALGEYVRARLGLGVAALGRGDASRARAEFASALVPPASLGEVPHPLANRSEVYFWIGEAELAAGDAAGAARAWEAAAAARGDFKEMSVEEFSEATLYTALALRRLGKNARARALLRALLHHGRALASAPAKIDYFATSLPNLLVFDEDIAARQAIRAGFLRAQALVGLGRSAEARRELRRILGKDPNHDAASDLLRILSRNATWLGA